jgi:glyoxalase family protein
MRKEISGLHHITLVCGDAQRTVNFYTGILGLRLVKMTSNFDDPTSAHWYWGTGNGEPGTLITYFERRPGEVRQVRMGQGQTHHYALSVPDNGTQLAFKEELEGRGWPVSPVMDRIYFMSIYTRDPDGHIVELATAGPGFLADEAGRDLGQSLKLPP